MKYQVKITLLLITLMFVLHGIGQAAELLITVRDAATGQGLAGQAGLTSQAIRSEIDLATGQNRLAVESGYCDLTVTCEGYKPLSTYFNPGPQQTLTVTIWLDPDVLKAETVEEELFPEEWYSTLTGHIVDNTDFQALAGVQIRLAGSNFQTLSDDDGFFSLCVPAEEVEPGFFPPERELTFEKAGWVSRTLGKVIPLAGRQHFIIELESGHGHERLESHHKFFTAPDLMPDTQITPDLVADENDRSALENSLELDSFGIKAPMQPWLVVHDPPDTIRLGTSCSCWTCSGVEVLTLETYTKRGLNDEWISSWYTHSLRAGAIAYRSYGAYYAYHPGGANFDICNNTCCQVNDSDTSTSTNTATEKTAGIVLQRSSAVFRSEYSAENNAWDDPNDGLSCSNSDLSCGDAYAGSPAASWPCLSDSLCSGHGCFGHGRGMCQWGTSRWANSGGQLFNWITNHYYNASGAGSGYRTAYMTSPISLSGASPVPATVSAGEQFTINVSASNYAEYSHYQIMIGASLYSVGTGYISDPAHDTKVTLVSGSNNVSRPFTVPGGTADGSYDLIVALWLDANEDNIISGDDLSLISLTSTGAVTVSSVTMGTCSNPYDVDSFPFIHEGNTGGGLATLSGYNCNSLRPAAAAERVYTLMITQMGTLQATLTTAAQLDVYLLSACDNYACCVFADTSFSEENLGVGDYWLVVDGPETGTYTLELDFTSGDGLRPATITDLLAEKDSGQLRLWWSAIVADILDNQEDMDHYVIMRGTSPTALSQDGTTSLTTVVDDVLLLPDNYYYRIIGVDSADNQAHICPEITMDNDQAVFAGAWTEASSQPDRYGPTYHWISSLSTGSLTASYFPVISCDATYKLYVWYPATTNRCPQTSVTINHESGTTTEQLDQTSNGGRWHLIGFYPFRQDLPASIVINDAGCATDTIIVADGLRLIPEVPVIPPLDIILDDDQATFVGSWVQTTGSGYNNDYYWRSTGGTGANYAKWWPVMSARRMAEVYVWYRASTNRTSQAPYTVTTVGGDVLVTVDQKINDNQWVYIGTWELDPATVAIKVSDAAPSGEVVIADAVRVLEL